VAQGRPFVLGCAWLLVAATASCDGAREPVADPEIEEISWVSEQERADGPPHARWDMVSQLREDLASERHPSDGGGRAWLELAEDGSGDRAVAGRSGSWTVLYEAGPLGITEGGAIGLQVSPFWGWSTPQTQHPQRLGYTTVEYAGPGEPRGLELEAATWGDQLLGITVAGRGLEPGERVRIHYGAGPAGATADRYAEEAARLWIGVDGDGDGVRGLLPDSPSVTVDPDAPAGLILTLPGTLRPGERGRLTVAAVDASGNVATELIGEVTLEVLPPGLELDTRLRLGPGDGGRGSLRFTAPDEGLFQVRATGPEGLLGQSNPVLVSAQVPRVHFGDVHGHSAISDGTGSPEAYYRYARDVAGLDFAALTDHDHWGMRFLDAEPELWELIVGTGQRFHEPGAFVTLLGYEWTSWIHGHRHVLFFGDQAQVYSSLDPRYEHPQGLWDALRGQPAITIPHHSGGGPIPTDWSIPPDPEIEPLVEVASVHGISEAADAPGAIYSPVAGSFARDALDMGYGLGFIGGGDSHDGHPGLAWLASNQGGLVAVLDAELSREGIHEAFQSRRVYATNGARTLLFTTLDGEPMGSRISPAQQGELVLFAVGDAPLHGVEIIRSGAISERIPADSERMVQATIALEDLSAGEYLYVRVLQKNGGVAVSSPFFVGAEPATMPASRTE
jgi:hypothetical protein